MRPFYWLLLGIGVPVAWIASRAYVGNGSMASAAGGIGWTPPAEQAHNSRSMQVQHGGVRR